MDPLILGRLGWWLILGNNSGVRSIVQMLGFMEPTDDFPRSQFCFGSFLRQGLTKYHRLNWNS